MSVEVIFWVILILLIADTGYLSCAGSSGSTDSFQFSISDLWNKALLPLEKIGRGKVLRPFLLSLIRLWIVCSLIP